VQSVGARDGGACTRRVFGFEKCIKWRLWADSRIHQREGQTEECILKTEGKGFYTKLVDKYKIAKIIKHFLMDITAREVDTK